MDQEFQRVAIREEAFKLTLLTYKAASLLPENEPLRHQMQKHVLAFLAVLYAPTPVSLWGAALMESFGRLEVCIKMVSGLPSYAHIHFGELDNAYTAIFNMMNLQSKGHEATQVPIKRENRYSFEQEGDRSVQKNTEQVGQKKPLSDRQKFILQFAESHNRFQLKDITTHFPSCSEKTIRNDLLVLCGHGYVDRVGVAPRSYYEVTRGAVLPSYNAEPIRIGMETLSMENTAAVTNAEIMR